METNRARSFTSFTIRFFIKSCNCVEPWLLLILQQESLTTWLSKNKWNINIFNLSSPGITEGEWRKPTSQQFPRLHIYLAWTYPLRLLTTYICEVMNISNISYLLRNTSSTRCINMIEILDANPILWYERHPLLIRLREIGIFPWMHPAWHHYCLEASSTQNQMTANPNHLDLRGLHQQNPILYLQGLSVRRHLLTTCRL